MTTRGELLEAFGAGSPDDLVTGEVAGGACLLRAAGSGPLGVPLVARQARVRASFCGDTDPHEEHYVTAAGDGMVVRLRCGGVR